MCESSEDSVSAEELVSTLCYDDEGVIHTSEEEETEEQKKTKSFLCASSSLSSSRSQRKINTPVGVVTRKISPQTPESNEEDYEALIANAFEPTDEEQQELLRYLETRKEEDTNNKYYLNNGRVPTSRLLEDLGDEDDEDEDDFSPTYGSDSEVPYEEYEGDQTSSGDQRNSPNPKKRLREDRELSQPRETPEEELTKEARKLRRNSDT